MVPSVHKPCDYFQMYTNSLCAFTIVKSVLFWGGTTLIGHTRNPMGMWTVDMQCNSRIHDCTVILLHMNNILGVADCSHVVMGNGVWSVSQEFHRAVAVSWELCIVMMSVLQLAYIMNDRMCSHQALYNVYNSFFQCITHRRKCSCAKDWLLWKLRNKHHGNGKQASVEEWQTWHSNNVVYHSNLDVPMPPFLEPSYHIEQDQHITPCDNATVASERAPKQVSTHSPTGSLDWGFWDNDVSVQMPWCAFHLLDCSRRLIENPIPIHLGFS